MKNLGSRQGFMSRNNNQTLVITIAVLALVVAVAYIFIRMQAMRPLDYQGDMRFKTLPTANPPGIWVS